MRIESFTIGKGKTTKPHADLEEWNKRYLELTVRLPEQCTEEDLHSALSRAEQIIDTFLGQVDVSSVPDLDLAAIEELPWRLFKKGSKLGSALPDNPGWIFSNQEGAEKLAAAIQKAGKLELGEWIFKFGGTEKSLIQRTKKKEAKP